MIEEEKPDRWQVALGFGSILLAITVMAQFRLFSSVLYNAPQSALDLELSLKFYAFVLGNLFMAYGLLGYGLNRITPKPPKWDAKLEVKKWMDKD